jgi:hypothetical protein
MQIYYFERFSSADLGLVNYAMPCGLHQIAANFNSCSSSAKDATTISAPARRSSFASNAVVIAATMQFADFADRIPFGESSITNVSEPATPNIAIAFR